MSKAVATVEKCRKIYPDAAARSHSAWRKLKPKISITACSTLPSWATGFLKQILKRFFPYEIVVHGPPSFLAECDEIHTSSYVAAGQADDAKYVFRLWDMANEGPETICKPFVAAANRFLHRMKDSTKDSTNSNFMAEIPSLWAKIAPLLPVGIPALTTMLTLKDQFKIYQDLQKIKTLQNTAIQSLDATKVNLTNAKSDLTALKETLDFEKRMKEIGQQKHAEQEQMIHSLAEKQIASYTAQLESQSKEAAKRYDALAAQAEVLAKKVEAGSGSQASLLKELREMKALQEAERATLKTLQETRDDSQSLISRELEKVREAVGRVVEMKKKAQEEAVARLDAGLPVSNNNLRDFVQSHKEEFLEFCKRRKAGTSR